MPRPWPQTHLRAQAKDRVLQRRTTLKEKEPDKYPPLSEVNPITHLIGLTATRLPSGHPGSSGSFQVNGLPPYNTSRTGRTGYTADPRTRRTVPSYVPAVDNTRLLYLLAVPMVIRRRDRLAASVK
jgi:hypothetical protein